MAGKQYGTIVLSVDVGVGGRYRMTGKPGVHDPRHKTWRGGGGEGEGEGGGVIQ